MLGTCGAASYVAVYQVIRWLRLSAVDRRRPSVRALYVPQLHLGRSNLPGPTLPHPCVRVAVDEREPIPRPHPQRHQVKARARTLWRKPVPSWEHPRWRTPPTRRKHQAWLRGNWPTPPRFRCRRRPSAAWCEPCNPAKTTRPSHVPMMPLPDVVDVMLADLKLGCCRSNRF